jgi:ATPase subunit of ABC transporter with duplicated ATPase domains
MVGVENLWMEYKGHYRLSGSCGLDRATKEMLVDVRKDFEGTMIFVSHDRTFLRGLGSRVLELGGESGTDRNPTVYPGSYVEYVQKLGHEALGIYS